MTCIRQIILSAVQVLLICSVMTGLHPAAAIAEPDSVIHAFYLDSVPAKYEETERLFHDIKSGGANTIILHPLLYRGSLDRNTLKNQVFIAHREGLKLFIILETRNNSQLLSLHPEWEDFRYDIESRSLQRTERIDLFQRAAIDAIAKFSGEAASFSIDGILLADDFYYDETEGMSPYAIDLFNKIFGKELEVSDVFPNNMTDGYTQHAYNPGETFWNWTDLKKNMLLNLFKSIAKSAWAVNSRIKLGIPFHVDDFITPKDELAHFGYDIIKWKKMEIDYYWLAIRHRDIRATKKLSYAKTMEMLSRSVNAMTTIMNDPARTIIAVQTFDSTGKTLPLTEIEEAAALVKHAGNPSIAFIVNTNTELSSELTNKIFRQSAP